MNLLLKLTLVALVSNQLFALPSSKDKRSAQDEDEGDEELSWWEALLNSVWDWVTGIVSDVVWGVLDGLSSSVQSFFDQIFATEDEDLAREAEDVILDGDLATDDGEALIADGQLLLDIAEGLRNTTITDVDQAEVDALIASFEAAGNAIIAAGNVVIAEADFLTKTLAATAGEQLNQTVVDASEARVAEAVNAAQEALGDAQAALEDLLDKSDDLAAALPDGEESLTNMLNDLVNTVDQFTSFVNEVWTLAKDIWEAGLDFFGL